MTVEPRKLEGWYTGFASSPKQKAHRIRAVPNKYLGDLVIARCGMGLERLHYLSISEDPTCRCKTCLRRFAQVLPDAQG